VWHPTLAGPYIGCTIMSDAYDVELDNVHTKATILEYM
jgi:hypothetical protein